MSRIVSYYPREIQFQLSSQSQLANAQKESTGGFKWTGRTLISWTDQNNNSYDANQTLTADSIQPLKLSANWKLNEYKISVDFKTGHGKVVVTTSCDEMPLPSGIASRVELEKNAQTSSNILYNSLLSIDAVPENEEYETTRFDVNGVGQVLSDQYVYKNADSGDKTGSNAFNVIVGFNTNLDVAGVSVFTVDGSATRVPYSTLPANTLRMFDSNGNPISPFDGYEKIKKLSVASIVDPHSLVSAIGDNSFYNCTNLSSIECSNALSIGNNAFYQCYGLPSACFPSAEIIGDHAFFRCSSLTSIECSNVISIGIGAFYDGNSSGYEVKIQTIDIPNAICIGGAAFNGCKELHDANLENVLSIFGSNGTAYQRYNGAFSRCIRLSSVKAPKAIYIEKEAFNECSNLSSIDLPSVNTLGDISFLSCASLSSVDFPNVEKAGVRCFGDCPSLISANLPKLSSAGKQLFENCTNLSSASLESLENTGSSTFSNCRALISVYIPNAKTIGSNAFEGCNSIVSLDLPNAQKFEYETFIDNLQLTSLYCPKLSSFETAMASDSRTGAIIRSKNSFRGASHLLSVYVNNGKMHSIGNGYGERDQLIVDSSESCILYGVGGISKLTNDTVKKIGDGAFVHGKSISSINCGNLLSIGDYAFYGATISSIDMSNVSYIGYGSFYRGNGPKNVYSQSVKNILIHTFEENNGIESVDLPMVSSIDTANIFMNSTGLKSVHLSSVKHLPSQTFRNCSQLASISCENLSSISIRVFNDCTELTSIYFPRLKKFINPTSYNVYATFISCTSLKTANLSSIEEIESYCGGDGVFENCKSLEYVNLANINNIQDYMFRQCSSLTTIKAISAVEIGNNAFMNCSSLTGFDAGNFSLVSAIQENAFQNCVNLLSASFPNVKKIYGLAFQNAGTDSSTAEFPNLNKLDSEAFKNSNFRTIDCQNLGSLGFSSFSNCKNLISCYLPLISAIPSYTFADCVSLTSIESPNVEYIAYHAFNACSSLISVDFPSLTSMGSNPSLNHGVFQNCSSLTNVDIPNCLSICGRDFYNCVNLYSINVPKLKYVSNFAFYNCGLSSINLPNVETLEIYSLYCENLSSVFLSANAIVPNVSTTTFYKRPYLISVYIPEGMIESYEANSNWKKLSSNGVIKIIPVIQYDPSYTRFVLADGTEELCSIVGDLDEQWINEYGQYDESTDTWDKDIVHVDIGNAVTSIGDYVFSSCRNLSNIIIPNTVTNIGEGAFKNCDSLLSIAIPKNVLNIKGLTFDSCISLSNVIIPNNVSSIGTNAFYNCDNLSNITIGNDIQRIEPEAFYNCDSLTSLTIPNSITYVGMDAFRFCPIINVIITNNDGDSIAVQQMLITNVTGISQDVNWTIEQ